MAAANITDEEFDAWRENPVTRWFMRAFATVADANEAIAKDHAWVAATSEQADKIDTHLMTVLAEKVKAYRSVHEATFEQIQGFAEGSE